ncbi:MAG: hypothetical protein PQJ44_06975 [Sphaerochaetaceae bacterium]|nr:hypothetical protein [Sphaerochaetaceae bacterium]
MASGRASSTFTAGTDQVKDATSTNIDPSGDPLTGAVWVYFTAPSANRCYIGQTGTGTGRDWVQTSTTNTIRSRLGGTTTVGSTTLSGSTWYFLAATFPGGTDTLTLYVDAVSDGSGSITGESVTSNTLIVGDNGVNADTTQHACASFYKQVLSAAELQEIMYNPFSIPSFSYFPDLLENGNYRDLSPDQNGNSTVTGTVNASANGPPIFLLGGQ